MSQTNVAGNSNKFPSDFFYRRNNQMNEVTHKKNMNTKQLKSNKSPISNSKGAIKLLRKPEKRDSYLSRVTLEKLSPL